MHRKDIKALKKKAAAAWDAHKKDEAYQLWNQADKERKALQKSKLEKKAK